MNSNEGINYGLNNDNYNYKMPSYYNRFNKNDFYNRQINPNNQILGNDDIINMNSINNNSSRNNKYSHIIAPYKNININK